jgi:hypothetical protein
MCKVCSGNWHSLSKSDELIFNISHVCNVFFNTMLPHVLACLFCSTEAGKLALNLTQGTTSNTGYCKTTTGNTAVAMHRKATPITLPATTKKKVITIRAGQFIGKSGPNILKRVDPDGPGGPPTKVLVARAGVPVSTSSRSTVRIGINFFVQFHSLCIQNFGPRDFFERDHQEG